MHLLVRGPIVLIGLLACGSAKALPPELEKIVQAVRDARIRAIDEGLSASIGQENRLGGVPYQGYHATKYTLKQLEALAKESTD
ncbi:hypothetical protein EON82_11390 [bacterium]|nr:MAG: hypothetical protein EON82_11390 [bacterium]